MKTKLLSLLVLATAALSAEIRPINSLELVEKEFSQCNKETLVLIDIGWTLLGNRNAFMHKGNHAWVKQWFDTHVPNITRDERAAITRVIEGDLTQWQLLDPSWPSLIRTAQDTGSKAVIFTRVFVDPSLKMTRANMIRGFNLPIKNDLPDLISGETYLYGDGIIETEGYKGPALDELLGNLSTLPKKIVFIDDRLDQIQSVEETCKKWDIPLTAFHFTAYNEVPPLNEAMADLQLRTLVEEHRLIPDEEFSCGSQEKKLYKQSEGEFFIVPRNEFPCIVAIK